jgi:hypothetical protein
MAIANIERWMLVVVGRAARAPIPPVTTSPWIDRER